MSILTYFPQSKSRWNKRMIEKVKALPTKTVEESVKVKNKGTGKVENKTMKVPLTKGRIKKIVTSRYNLDLSNKWTSKKREIEPVDSTLEETKSSVEKIKKSNKKLEN